MKINSKRVTMILAAGMLASTAGAQVKAYNNEPYVSKVHVGLGFGLDYGGMGFRVEYLPVKYVGIFGGGGYNFQSVGLNAGLAFRPFPDAKIQPIAMAMYGYNGAIKIEGDTYMLSHYGLDGVTKTYYGLSTGLGFELKVGKKGNRLYAGVWYPFRSKEFEDNYDKVQDSPYIQEKGKVLPVTFSIGFNWAL